MIQNSQIYAFASHSIDQATMDLDLSGPPVAAHLPINAFQTQNVTACKNRGEKLSKHVELFHFLFVYPAMPRSHTCPSLSSSTAILRQL